MKKKIFVFLLAVLLVCALSACGCQHEWTEASCMAAKTCAECGETEGEALGHDFASATCTAAETCTRCGETRGEALGHAYTPATCTEPETCTRCGETQGEAAGHTYGFWTAEVESDTMTHKCAVCAEEETVALDYTRILEEELQGHWDLFSIVEGNREYNAYYLNPDALGMYLNFQGGNNVEIFLDKEGYPKKATWVYDAYEIIDGAPVHYFSLVEEKDASISVVYSAVYVQGETKEDSMIMVLDGSDGYILLIPNLMIAQAVEGTWADSKDGQVCTMTFAADRTFTGNIGGEISGTWHLKPVHTSYGYRSCNILLRYSKDGSNQIVQGYISFGSEDIPMEEYLEWYDPNMSIYGEDFGVQLTRMTKEELARLEAALAEGEQVLVGPWTSSYIYTYSNGNSNETTNEDYSITFAEDGTFTAVLDQERSGTWSFQEATVQDSYTSYSYHLNFEGVADTVYAYISDEDLSFSKYDNRTSTSTSIHFLQMTEEKIAQREAEKQEALARVVGDWNSLCVEEYEDENNNHRTVLDYTISVKEDGTFTAALDQERAGTWEFRDSYSYDDGYQTRTIYNYTLHLDGVEESVSVSVSPDDVLSVSTQSKSISFSRISPEELAAVQKQIVGTWTVDSAALIDRTTWMDTPFTDCDYTLTVREDGTYTAEFSESVSGTWAVYPSNGDLAYIFGMGKTGRIYKMDDNGCLQIWCDVDENTSVDASMKKN